MWNYLNINMVYILVWVFCVAATLRYSECFCRKQLLSFILTHGYHGGSIFCDETYRRIYMVPILILNGSITACIDSPRPKIIGWMLRASQTGRPGLRYIATFILRCTSNRSMDTYCEMSNHVSEMPLNRSKHLHLNGVICISMNTIVVEKEIISTIYYGDIIYPFIPAS